MCTSSDDSNGVYVSGSGTLVRALLADGLVDELHLFVYPLTAAGGSRLFTDGLPPTRWSRTACEADGNGVVHLQFALAPPGGSGEAAERPG